MKNWLGGALVGALLVAVGAGGTYFFLKKDRKFEEPKLVVEVTPTPVSSEAPAVTEEEIEEESVSDLPEGWMVYESTDYGFSIGYPSNFEALDDAENLYGWENGIVLLYGGGQSYDVPVEVWDTKAEYEIKYPDKNYTVIEVGGQYITATNINGTLIGGQIIGTLKALP